MGPYPIEEREQWRWWVTPKPLAAKPIHRWYTFPHSYASEIVQALIGEWGLTPADRVLDLFAGSGTTLLAAKEMGIPATGYDLSPFAVLVSRVKIADYDAERLERFGAQVLREVEAPRSGEPLPLYPALVQKAFPGTVLTALHAIDQVIVCLDAQPDERDFLRLALLATMSRYSRAVADGGWLRWVDRRVDASGLRADFASRVAMMVRDLPRACPSGRVSAWRVAQADARTLPDTEATYTAVITSPPYPNRHDYTRVFGVELLFGFLDVDGARQLRYQSLHSHPEARPRRPAAPEYVCPPGLAQAVAQIRARERDARVGRMLEGYFLDLYLVLREIRRVCRSQARVALVVGNVQYQGVPVLTDQWTAEIGEQAGLQCEKVLAVRYRGNSAQQMGRTGKRPSRESVVLFQVP